MDHRTIVFPLMVGLRKETSIMYSNQPEKINNGLFPRLKRFMSFGVIALGVFAMVLMFSRTAHAGLISLFASLIGNTQVSAETEQPANLSDSQVLMSITLQAAGNPTEKESVSEIPPLDGETSLSPEIARMNATSTEPTNTQISIYVVRSGDSLSGVAELFNVSINTILWANDLNSRSILRPGQTLVILPVTGIKHTIKSKDTLQGIALKYGADIEDILNYNDLTLSSKLQIGNQIIIPDAEMATPSIAQTTPSKTTKAGNSVLLDGWNYPAYPNYFTCPVPEARVSQVLHGHNAVDLAAPRGTPIVAAASGTVIINRANGAWNGGYGNFVVILHPNGSQTLYAHMSKSLVSSGSEVRKSQTIGYIGMTGLTTGPHTHFEIRGAQNPFGNQNLCR